MNTKVVKSWEKKRKLSEREEIKTNRKAKAIKWKCKYFIIHKVLFFSRSPRGHPLDTLTASSTTYALIYQKKELFLPRSPSNLVHDIFYSASIHCEMDALKAFEEMWRKNMRDELAKKMD